MHLQSLAAVLAGQLLLTSSAFAITITVDGNLADWQINPSNWEPSPTARQSGVKYAGGNQADPTNHQAEDSTGGQNVQIYPGWGGQLYDAEAFYVHVHTNTLFFAIVTGLPPTGTTTVNTSGQIQNGNGTWTPGDIAVDFGNDGKYEFGIETTGLSGGQAHGNAGSVFRVDQVDQWQNAWLKTPYRSGINDFIVSDPTSMHGGTDVGQGSLVYTATPVTGWGQHSADAHYFIEGSVPLSLFDGLFARPFTLHWTMDCGNDEIEVDPPEAEVPEPATFALLSLGLAGIGFARRTRPRR